MNDPITYNLELGPGSVLVVGPHGRFSIHRHASGKVCVTADKCDFVGAEGMSRAQRALVDERWALRTEDGTPVLSEIYRHELELAKERDQRQSRVDGAKNKEGGSSANTGGASDLPELRSQEELDRDEFSRIGRGQSLWPLGVIVYCVAVWGVLAWIFA